MACQVKRDKNGDITRILAANGKESLAYNSLLEAVSNHPDINQLKEQYKSWVGKHINSVDDPKELALALYKQLHSPNFKNFFGDWEGENKENVSKVVDDNGEPLVVYHGSKVKGIEEFKPSIPKGPGSQTSSIFFAGNKKAAEVHGREGEVYPAFLNIRNPFHSNKIDVSIPESNDGSINKESDPKDIFSPEYVAKDAIQVKSVFNKGQFSNDDKNIYQQTGTDSLNPSKASPETLKKMKEFLDRVGVEVKTLQNIVVNGNKIGANGLADPLNRLIQITQGKEDIALPEEAMHIAVELIQNKNPILFREMMNKIGTYNLFNEVISEYGGLKEYQNEDGKPNIPKIKKETIAKVLAQTVIDKNENANENPALLTQTKNWWQKIIEFLKGLFNKAGMNPFETAAEAVLSADPNKLEAFNPNAVRAELKLSNALKDPRAIRWFDTLYKKGQQDTFFNKLQQDLQVPKGQVDILKDWVKENKPTSASDMLVGVLADMSYTVEIKVGKDNGHYEPMIQHDEHGEGIGVDNEFVKGTGQPSDYYSSMTVPGGTNYRENEIAIPGITPAIEGHAAFSTQNGIGWFRSDDKSMNPVTNSLYDKTPNELQEIANEAQISIEELKNNMAYRPDAIPSKTRRILEVQSDLFQQGRNMTNLEKDHEIRLDKEITKEEYDNINVKENYDDGGGVIGPFYTKVLGNTRYTRNTIGSQPYTKVVFPERTSRGNFLEVLSKENNWVTFFTKSIIQDSARKGYENVHFPAGSTAAKVEGHQTIEDFIKQKEERINTLKKDYTSLEERLISYDTNKNEDELSDSYLDAQDLSALQGKMYSTELEIEHLQEEVDRAKSGQMNFSTIANFYEKDIQNILKKQGYSPERIKDEYGNEWFSVKLDLKHTNEFYFQLSGTDALTNKLQQDNKQIAKVKDGYELNGVKIRKTVDERVKEVNRDWQKTLTPSAKKSKDFKDEVEAKTKEDLKDILHRYVDDNGDRRAVETPHVNPSALNPYNNEFYNTLESHIAERLDTYETGTKFFPGINVYDSLGTAGTIDLLAVLPSGKIDILQFKTPEVGFGATDINKKTQEAYNTEIEEFRKILEKGYKVRRSQFNQTRVLPVKTDFEYAVPGDPASGLKLKEMKVGNTNVALVKDDTLLPVPSSSESTGNQKFDKLISRLKGLVAKLALERVTPDKRFEKNNRIAALIGSIRKLQVQGNATGVLQTAGAIIKGQQEKYTRLQGIINILDPVASTTEELNKVAEQIMNEKDQVELYAGIYNAFKSVFNDGTNESKEYLKKARDISDDADDVLADYWDMAVDFRTQKLAAKFGITDEFKPEKQLTWYRKIVRSLSQSSIKAGDILWGLVNNINNRFQLQFQDRLKELKKIEEGVDKWMSGKNIKDLYSKIFAMGTTNQWNGSVIKKYSSKFYDDLRIAQEKGDLRWVLNNIDKQAYQDWYYNEHVRRVDESKTARYHPDDKENAKIIHNQLADFVRIFSISSKTGVNLNNYKLASFPKQGLHESDEYKELLKPENAPLLKLYEHWSERLKESFDSGMIEEHNGWSWFPNVRRNLIEKLTTAKAGGKLGNLFGGLRIEAEDTSFGKIDPLTNKPIDEVHAAFVHDLEKWVGDAATGYWDASEKSMDIFKVMAIWDREILKYNLKTESEDLAKLLHYTEAGQNEDFQKGAYKTKRSGTLDKDEKGNPIVVSNEINAKYIKDHIDAVWYNKGLSDESDISIEIPVKGIVTKVNKLFGKEVLSVPAEDHVTISGIKGLQAMNRFFVTKTLGLNVFTAAANLFGGSVNSYINQGKFFDKKDLMEAEAEYTSGRFWYGDNDKIAGLISYLHPYLEDKTHEEIQGLSVSRSVRWLSSDHLFYLQRGSDNFVNRVIAIAFMKNTMLRNGELINIREYARKELGHSDKYAGTYEDVQAFNKKLEARVEELKKSPESLLNSIQITNDQIVIPGVDRNSPTLIKFRQSIIEFIKDALGNTSREDLSLYKRSVMWQSFFMFKNWIPRMLDVRGQSLKYNPGSQQYEWGRIRMLGNAVFNLAKNKNTSILALLSTSDKSLIQVAKETYEKKKQYAADQEQDFTLNEAEFIDMYIKGVRAEFKELALAIGLMALLVAARHAAPDKDTDPHLKGGYKWMLRGLDKLQDEVSFFYNPKSFTDIVNGSVFPAVGMLVDMQKFLSTGVAKMWYTVIGNEQAAKNEKVSKYLFKVLPITKELMTYVAIFNADIAKEYGIKISSQNGSSR